MYDQDIIEKKPSSPIATAMLGVACAALIGCIVLQGIMLKKMTVENQTPTASAKAWYSDNVKGLNSKAKKLGDSE